MNREDSPFLIVDAVLAPTVTAPKNSKIAAARMACFIDKLLDETDVANEFATSFAPIMKASRVQKMTPMAKR